MAKKRFHDILIWHQDWFTELPKAYMFFWLYVKDTCDHAGIWKPNKKIFEFLVEEKIYLEKALEYFNNGKERILVLKNGDWLLIDFFCFQYGQSLNVANRVHKSILDRYKENGVKLTSIRGLIDSKYAPKDKDLYKDISNKAFNEEDLEVEYSGNYYVLDFNKTFPNENNRQPIWEAWHKWVDRCCNKRSPLDGDSARAQLKFLAGVNDPVDAINYSIEKNYKGLYERNNNGQKAKSQKMGLAEL